jgi:hypothetical protein
MSEEIFKERKSKLERILIDISDLRINQSTKDFSFYSVGSRFNFHINDIPIRKEVIKISRNEWLDIEYIFIKTVQ